MNQPKIKEETTMKKLLFAALYDAVFEGITEDNLYTNAYSAGA
mgnify:CR=1 FL=1